MWVSSDIWNLIFLLCRHSHWCSPKYLSSLIERSLAVCLYLWPYTKESTQTNCNMTSNHQNDMQMRLWGFYVRWMLKFKRGSCQVSQSYGAVYHQWVLGTILNSSTSFSEMWTRLRLYTPQANLRILGVSWAGNEKIVGDTVLSLSQLKQLFGIYRWCRSAAECSF